MEEQELKKIVKHGIKTPSAGFTDGVMDNIAGQHVKARYYPGKRFMLIACLITLILSIFVRIPNIDLLSYTIEFSPVIAPVLSLLLFSLVIQQLYEVMTLATTNVTLKK